MPDQRKAPVAVPRGLSAGALAAVLVSLVAIVGILAREDPYFGVMDDWHLLGWGEQLRAEGLAAGTWRFLVFDAGGWGTVRAFYPAMVYALYGLTGGEPGYVFLANAALVVMSLAAIGVALEAAARGVAPAGPVARPSRVLTLALYGLLVLALPKTHDLFLFPSIQEKLVLAAVALALVWAARVRPEMPAWRF
jgi:hypothetical protein